MEQLKKLTYRPSRRQQLEARHLRATRQGKRGPAVYVLVYINCCIIATVCQWKSSSSTIQVPGRPFSCSNFAAWKCVPVAYCFELLPLCMLWYCRCKVTVAQFVPVCSVALALPIWIRQRSSSGTRSASGLLLGGFVAETGWSAGYPPNSGYYNPVPSSCAAAIPVRVCLLKHILCSTWAPNPTPNCFHSMSTPNRHLGRWPSNIVKLVNRKQIVGFKIGWRNSPW